MGNPFEQSFDQNDFEQEATKKIDASQSFDDLFDVLRQIELVPGSLKPYPAERLIAKIDTLRENARESIYIAGWNIGGITRTYGLRAKVQELLIAEYPALGTFIEELKKVEEHNERREKKSNFIEVDYKKKLDEEYPVDPEGELSADVNDPRVKAQLEKMLESKSAMLRDVAPRQLINDEDLLILRVHEEILEQLIEQGTVNFENVKVSIEIDDFFFSMQGDTASLTTYALRKGWQEMKNSIERL